jgi:hypothetical protein
MTRPTSAIGIVAILAALGATPAEAAGSVALVEDVSGSLAGVEFMDYLAAGQQIRLGAKDRLVIDYLRSCLRETITGGSVTIGAEQSAVTGGKVSREKVECDGGKLKLSTDQAAKSGVVVFRGLHEREAAGEVVVERTIYGLSPIIELRGTGRLTVDRLDATGAPLVFDVAPGQLLHGAFYDLAKNGGTLAAGGVYRASFGGRAVVFQVDSKASSGATAPVGRLLKL